MFSRITGYTLLASLILFCCYTKLYAADKNKVTLVSEYNPPFVYKDDNGKFIGTSVSKLRPIMEKAGIEVEFKTYPWKRALAALNTLDDALIYPLSRIAEREENFSWVIPIHKVDFKLYSLKGKHSSDLINLNNGDYSFVCVDKTVLCSILKSFDIPESQIVKLSTIDDRQMIDMVVRGRIDYVLITDSGLKHHLKVMNLDPSLLVPNQHYKYQIEEYLAGNLQFDSKLMQRIQKAALELETKSKN